MASKFKFFPEDWEPDNRIVSWCHEKGLTDKQVSEQLEEIKDHEFNPMRSCPNRTFRRWIRNAIKWGHVVPQTQREYRTTAVELTEKEKADNVVRFEEQIKRLTGGKK